ncbi:hypothetical protein HYT01_03760 [Candidatus Giovannonibacteria bacterium]|nr:hypothetical protein [Candidatus Giovannonibacteria bacterium]
MNWAQLLAWVNAVRTLAELSAVAAAFAPPVPAGGTLAQVRGRLRTRIAAQPDPLAPVPAAIVAAAGGVPAPPPPPPPPANALPIWMIILLIVAALEMVSDLVGLVVNLSAMYVVTKTWVLTFVLGFSLAWNIGAIVAINVFNPPALTNRRKRNGTYWATFSSAFILITLFLIWIPLGIPMLVLMWGVELLLVLIWISDGLAAYYLLR